MASDEYKKMQASKEKPSSRMPKHKQLIQMLSFRIVPAYFKEIEKVANHKKMSVSKLIRKYIKEGMRRDKELTISAEKEFRIE